MTPHLKAALPLALLTAIGMLATDLYLPAVPSLPETLGGTVAQAQYTLASFLAALAISQLLWGWSSDRFGESLTIKIGTVLLLIAGIGCALAPNVEFLIFIRAIQGLGAGAATVAVPALIRKRFNEVDSVKAVSMVASIEALVPAGGPVLGAVLISFSSWRTSFWLLAVLTLLLIPFLTKVIGSDTSESKNLSSSYMPLLKNYNFMCYALSYSIMFGALILMVVCAPQIIVSWFQLEVYYFSIMQVLGVAAFIIFVTQSGKLIESKGITYVINVGMVLQVLSCIGFLIMGFLSLRSFSILTLMWCLFCAGLAIRGPATMTRALTLAEDRAGKASGLLMFLSFGICSVATSALAPYLATGFLPMALVLILMIAVSVVLTAKVQAPELTT